jgi:hypothetical protein
LIGWGLPAYLSFKALESPGHDDAQWLSYFRFKRLFILWLHLPAFHVSAVNLSSHQVSHVFNNPLLQKDSGRGAGHTRRCLSQCVPRKLGTAPASPLFTHVHVALAHGRGTTPATGTSARARRAMRTRRKACTSVVWVAGRASQAAPRTWTRSDVVPGCAPRTRNSPIIM